ncbi:MAG: AAA family ATPase [Rhodospirillales bacterium]|nr:AAA family ATPase [Rhodospirillales bacterium]
MTIRFDDSLPALAALVEADLGASVFEKAVFVRDATGYLSVVVDKELDDGKLAELNKRAVEVLGRYARSEDCIRDRNGPGSQRLLGVVEPNRVCIRGQKLIFVDRRMVGADWLLPPKGANIIPRIAFVSVKGGVGRSTALAVMAAHLSARGLRVLAIDLDLEAPGIGTMLISPDAMPEYGTLDYLVENGISGIDDDFMENTMGRSFLGSGGGRVTVLPAFGSKTIDHPSGGLAKIARAYLEDVQAGGGTVSLTDQIREMLERFEATGAHDVVLVDGRAGLHETTAAVVLGLGAETLLFGIDEPQTFIGYRLLLSHLASREGTEYDDWKQRIQFVHAKASADPQSQTEAAIKFRDLMTAFDPDSMKIRTVPPEDERLTADDFDLDWKATREDVVAEVIGDDTPIIRILDDDHYRAFDPVRQPALLTSDLFDVTFADLLRWADGVAGVGDQG